MAKKTIKITPEDIEGITLLSVEEAKKFPSRILSTGDWWWLRDPGSNPRGAAFVSGDGIISDSGTEVEDNLGAVRPALILDIYSFVFESLDEGDIIEVFGKKWYYNGDTEALLMDKPLTEMAFRNDWLAKDASNYQNSDIKTYLDNWLEQEKEENKMKKSTKKSGKCETTEAKKEEGRIKVKFMRYKNIVLVETLSLPERFVRTPGDYRPLITIGNSSISVCSSYDVGPYRDGCYLLTNRSTPVHMIKYNSAKEAEKAIKKFSAMIRSVNNLDELERTGLITEPEAEETETASFDTTIIAQ